MTSGTKDNTQLGTKENSTSVSPSPPPISERSSLRPIHELRLWTFRASTQASSKLLIFRVEFPGPQRISQKFSQRFLVCGLLSLRIDRTLSGQSESVLQNMASDRLSAWWSAPIASDAGDVRCPSRVTYATRVIVRDAW